MNLQSMELFLKTVGEETRLEIIQYLSRDTFCLCELVELVDRSQPSVSQHMKRLKEIDLVIEKKKGKWTFFSLNTAHELFPLVLHLTHLLPNNAQKIADLTDSGKRVTNCL